MKRWQVIAFAVVVLLGVAVVAGYRVGVHLLQGKIKGLEGAGDVVKGVGSAVKRLFGGDKKQ